MRLIPIVMAFDEAYAMPACVAVSSAVHSASHDSLYKFYLLSRNDLSKDAKSKFYGIAENGNIEIEFVVLGTRFDTIPIKNTYPIETYMILMLADIFPHMDKCIFLDADIVVLYDLMELWEYPIADAYIAGVIDIVGKQRHINLGLPDYRHYINSGVVIMNLDAIRKGNLTKEFLNLAINRFGDADQDILNKVCYGRIALLPLKYNLLFSWFINRNDEYFAMFSSDEIQDAYTNPVIIHYTDTRKPWNTSCVYAQMFHLWYKAARESPYGYRVKITQTKEANTSTKTGLLQEAQENYHRIYSSLEHKTARVIFFIPKCVFRAVCRIIRMVKG